MKNVFPVEFMYKIVEFFVLMLYVEFFCEMGFNTGYDSPKEIFEINKFNITF